jgi:hypothetical protein
MKKFQYIKGIIILITIIIFIIIMKDCNPKFYGLSDVFENIEESKKNGFFIFEYLPLTKVYKVDNKFEVNIDQIWVEEDWSYGNFRNPQVKNNGSFTLNFKIINNLPENDTLLYKLNWNNYDCTFSKYIKTTDTLRKRLIQYKNKFKDTIQINILKYHYSRDSLKIDTVKRITLVKKK